ncbi:MAG: preprotein translocase subunit SecG [Thermodesulfobacteriota bacterium]
MITILTIIHIVVCVFLIAIVLLQHGKGADMGAAFGGSSQTVFGTEGPLPLLNKVTTASAIIFMLTSLVLAYVSANPGKGSVMRATTPAPPPVSTSLEKAPEALPVPTAPAQEETAPAASPSATFPGEKEETPAAAPTTAPEPAPAAEPQPEQGAK